MDAQKRDILLVAGTIESDTEEPKVKKRKKKDMGKGRQPPLVCARGERAHSFDSRLLLSLYPLYHYITFSNFLKSLYIYRHTANYGAWHWEGTDEGEMSSGERRMADEAQTEETWSARA